MSDHSPDNEASPQPSGSFFFQDADIVQRLDLIQHLLQSSDRIPLLTGELGSGKTTLLAQVLARLQGVHCRVEAYPGMDGAAVLVELARCCDLPADCGEAALKVLLAEHASHMGRQDQIPLIAVDDAHLLTADALQMLLEVATPGPEPPDHWRLVLTSETTLEAHAGEVGTQVLPLDRLQVIRLPRFSLEQGEAFLTAYWRACGNPVEGELDRAQVQRMHRAADGLPGRLVELAGQNRLEPADADAPIDSSQPNPPDPGPTAPDQLPGRGVAARPGWRSLAGVVVAVCVVLVLVFQDRINAIFKGQAPATETPSTNLPEARLKALPTPSEGRSGDKPAIPPPEPFPRATRPTPSASDQSGTQTPEAPSGRDSGVGAARDSAPGEAGEPEPTSGPEAGPPAQPEPKPEPPPQPTGGPEPAPATDAGTQTEPEQPPAAAAPPAPEPSGPTGDTTADRDKTWVLARDPEHYTIQVLGSIHRETIGKVIERHGLHAEAAHYQIQYRGKAWYVLLYGVYPTRPAAMRAVEQLPAALRQNRPWIRQLADVQKEIRAGHK